MDNNVVDSICEALTARSFVSFKFNVRGVGGSEGVFSNGKEEQKDVIAAISFMTTLKEVDSSRMGVAGYSAGSSWGLAAGCQDSRVKSRAAVSPPLPMFDFNFLQECSRPKMMVSGTEDDLIPAKSFLKFCQGLPDIKECHLIEGADHMWWGFEIKIAEKIADFFVKNL
jgi:alpha/beta superfamily hydrolase